MDIVLDANVYRQDFRMRGTQFQELFTYLRRTNCSLVVPRAVLLEAKSNYSEFLSSTLRRLTREWDSVRKFAVSEIDELRAPIDIEDEVNLYSNLLLEPAPNVKVRLWDDYSGVDVEEVVRRGIERVKPANDNGEELRDVILWLIVVKYASEARCPVAFISDDGDFQGPDGSLHETLAADLAQAGVQVTLYKSIRDFITGNSLETEVLDERQFVSLINSELLEGEAQKSLKQTRESAGVVQQATILSVRFSSGKKYKVGENSFYVEGLMSGVGTLRVREYQYNVQLSQKGIDGPLLVVPGNFDTEAGFDRIYSAMNIAAFPSSNRASMWSSPTYYVPTTAPAARQMSCWAPMTLPFRPSSENTVAASNLKCRPELRLEA